MDKMAFEQRPRGRGGMNHEDAWEKCIQAEEIEQEQEPYRQSVIHEFREVIGEVDQEGPLWPLCGFGLQLCRR